MAKPLIGVTSYPRNHKDRFISPAAYLDAIANAGGIPVVLASDPVSEPGELIARLDGLVLSGGGDIHPSAYGGDEHEMVAYVNQKRDECELHLTKLAAEQSLPTLAICRGIQIVNVMFGGTLHEHLPDAFGDSVKHRSQDIKRRTKTRHPVSLDPNSTLANLLGEHEFECSSYHHQCVRDVARDFQAVGWSPDGVIEAIESKLYPKLISVQWHPEYNASESPIQQRLFEVLVEWSAAKHSCLQGSDAPFYAKELARA